MNITSSSSSSFAGYSSAYFAWPAHMRAALALFRLSAVVCFLVATFSSLAASDPQLSSWFTLDSSKFAQVYRSDSDKLSGRTATTWSNGRLSQSQPAYCGVQEVLYSANWVYIRSTGLGSHVMGPWYDDPQHWRYFPNLPTDQRFILRLPRHPTVQNPQTFNHLGEIGMFVDGVRMFDATDAFSYSTRDGRDANPMARIGHGDQIWNRDAYVNEALTFDAALGHQQNWGRYHYHAEPVALRYLLGDHVDLDPATKTYRESSTPPTKHSPILGWIQDGYPLYGPYGFSDPKNPSSGIRRMVSGFVPRNGKNGTDDLTQSGRHSVAAWVAREFNCSTSLAAYEFGPNVSPTYPIGHYLEDYAFLGDLGKTRGKDFDLDETNGRWCITPEFPQGTYAYFTTIDAQGKPVFPYNMGQHYHGNPAGRLVTSINEPVATNFIAQASQKLTATAQTRPLTLTWSPSSGGQYSPTP
jgi:hypothetical protein